MGSRNFSRLEGEQLIQCWKRAAGTSALIFPHSVYLISVAVLAACRFRSRPKPAKLSAWTSRSRCLPKLDLIAMLTYAKISLSCYRTTLSPEQRGSSISYTLALYCSILRWRGGDSCLQNWGAKFNQGDGACL